MSTLTATIAVGDDSAGIISALLRQFPKGSRVRLAVSPEEDVHPLTSVEDYRRRLFEAREAAPPCPWKSTAEAMRELREGEEP